MRHTVQGIATYIFFILLSTVSTNSKAWSIGELFGPSVSDVTFSYEWRYISKSELEAKKRAEGRLFFGGDGLLFSIQIENKSDHYLDRAELSCTMLDDNGNRIKKDYPVIMSSNAKIAPGNTMTGSGLAGGHNNYYGGSVPVIWKDVAFVTCTLIKVTGEK